MKLITILLCKVLAFVGELLGKGTSLPGKIALKLYPDILSRLTLPEHIIAVTGTTGKTSTVEILEHTLSGAGKKVICNLSGSNQIEGVTTLLLKHATLTGKVKGDVVLLESDERYARLTFRYVKPTIFVVNNLYRDQIGRHGHPFRVLDCLQMAVDLIPDATLLLNADDPLVSKLAIGHDHVVYFGMDKNSMSTPETDSTYNDCYYCPCCKHKLTFDFFHHTHLGSYHCDGCGFKREETAYSVTHLDLEQATVTVNGDAISLGLVSSFHASNLCAVYGAAHLTGIPGEKIAELLNNYMLQNGRVTVFQTGDNFGTVLLSKHETPSNYNQNLVYLQGMKEPFNMVFLLNTISRKYNTTDISWLWDTTFELLENSKVDKIYLAGAHAYDLALRLQYTKLDQSKFIIETDMDKLVELLKEPTENHTYLATCIRDRQNFLERVKQIGPTM